MNLQFETSNHCNLACQECPNHIMQRSRTYMSDLVFKKLLYEYIDSLENKQNELGYPPTIIFHKDGEPLLHPNLRYFMRQISDLRPEFRFNLYTNGLLLTKGFIDFLASLPNQIWLLISFHFHNHVGRSNDYSKIDYLMEKVLNAPKIPNIDFIFTSHVTRLSKKDDLNTWANIWKSKVPPGRLTIGVNDCINPWTGLIHEENCVTFTGCPYADFGHLFVGVTGNVIPCCMDLEEKLIFGNIMTDRKEVIYQRLNDFYAELRKGTVKEELCRRCLNK